MKVYVVEARNQLGRKIGNLAKAFNEAVFFHDYKEPVFGAPVVFLECSSAFLASVKSLPECEKAYEIPPGLATTRSATIDAHFKA